VGPVSSSRFEFPVEEGHVLMFRRAVGAPVTPQCASVVPPTFVQAGNHFDPEWPFRSESAQRSDIDQRSDVDPRPSDDIRHAEEHIEIVRQLRIGDRLTAVRSEGPTWTKVNSRGETLAFRTTLTDYLDEGGRPVVRTRSVGVVVSPRDDSGAV
jgi:hypothetical protein